MISAIRDLERSHERASDYDKHREQEQDVEKRLHIADQARLPADGIEAG
jgi:hypothetical protein